MILVDTTVWVDFFRGIHSPEEHAFQILLQKNKELLCLTDIVMTEILRGVVRDSDYTRTKNYLKLFPCLTARAPRTFVHAADLYRKCRKKGVTVRSTVDCLIAAVCIENDLTLLHHDADFTPFAKWCRLKIFDPQSLPPRQTD